MPGETSAEWLPDPFGRHELRYWNGDEWTHHVASGGRQAIDPPVSSPASPPAKGGRKKIRRAVRKAGISTGGQIGGGTLFTEPVLVVSQKAKLIEVNAEYAVFDQNGRKIGAVREVGQSLMKKAAVGGASRRLTHRLQVVDMDGRVLMALTRPAALMRSKMIVRGADGSEIGQITQKNLGLVGKIRFGLESNGKTLGSIEAEGWDNWDFSVQDTKRNELARITKTWAGLAKEWFTKADNYVVEIHRTPDEPLRSLMIAAALAVDTALRQGSQRIRLL